MSRTVRISHFGFNGLTPSLSRDQHTRINRLVGRNLPGDLEIVISVTVSYGGYFDEESVVETFVKVKDNTTDSPVSRSAIFQELEDKITRVVISS